MDTGHPESAGNDAGHRRPARGSGPVSAPAADDRSAPSSPATESPACASADLARLLRWEDSGGGWRVAGVGTESLTLSLVTCDGGEEMEVFTSTDPAVLGHVAGRTRHP